MKLYKVFYYSPCGTYFAPYLQSALILADSETEAIDIAVKEKLPFINKGDKKLGVDLICGDLDSKGVIDKFFDSDY